MTEHRHSKSRDAAAITKVVRARPYRSPPTTRGLSIHSTTVHSKMQLDVALIIDRKDMIAAAFLFTDSVAADLLRDWYLIPWLDWAGFVI